MNPQIFLHRLPLDISWIPVFFNWTTFGSFIKRNLPNTMWLINTVYMQVFTSRNHVTMVTAEHMNQLLKNVLKLIKKNIGNESAPWMTRIATYTQQIIINSSEELLRDSFLPLAERVRKRTDTMFHKEESLRGFIKVYVNVCT